MSLRFPTRGGPSGAEAVSDFLLWQLLVSRERVAIASACMTDRAHDQDARQSVAEEGVGGPDLFAVASASTEMASPFAT